MSGTITGSEQERTAPAAEGGPTRSDRRAVFILLAIPVVAFVVPALLGYPAIAGDNLIQNLPLRTLSGELLRQGHLPLWNPYIWSGNPLLGGLNAGSLYPFTLLFVILPPVTAWVGNLLVVYWAAGLGLYALSRQLGIGPRASILAAATYAYAGVMSGQLVHIGIVQGFAWIPLMVLAQLRLSWCLFGTAPTGAPAGTAPVGAPAGTAPVGAPAGTAPVGAPAGTAPRRRRPSPWPWVVLLAVTIGLCLLTGEPRAMGEAEAVAGVVTVWLALRPYPVAVGVRRRLVFVGYSLVGAAWAIALAAVQLLPGYRFISGSQRSSESFAFFISGSLHPQWSTLLLVPDLFGGDGILHQPTFFNSYNLPEVTGYVGLLPLVAAFALFTRSVGRHRDRRAGDWAMWLFLSGLGLLMAFGGYTWFGGLFGLIPFFNKLRLQSRNLGILDLGLAVLLGYWADRLLSSDWRQAAMTGWRRWVAAVPVLAALVLCMVAVAIPFRLETAFGSDSVGSALGASLRPWLLAELVVVMGAGAVVFAWGRLGPVGRRRLLSAVVAADLLLFTASTSVGLTKGHATVQPSSAVATAVLGSEGRFAIYDTTDLNVDDLSVIGQPDLNSFTGLSSVQGYGSLIASSYGNVTGSHDLDTLDPCALARGVFVPLRLHTVLTLPTSLAPQLGPNGQPTSMGGAPPMAPPGACPGARAPGTATSRSLYFGQELQLVSAGLVAPHAVGGTAPEVGVLRPGGATRWPAERVLPAPGGWSVRFSAVQPAAGLVIRGAVAARAVSDRSTVVTAGGARYSLNGQMQDALGQSGWRFTGLWRLYARFNTSAVRAPVWLVGAPPGARARQLSTSAWGTEVDRVRSSRAVTVVRSEAYEPGWRVVAIRAGDRVTRYLGVEQHGLVQSVRVPAGDWTITFLYRASGLNLGIAASAVGAGAVLAVAVAVLWRRRSRRPGR